MDGMSEHAVGGIPSWLPLMFPEVTGWESRGPGRFRGRDGDGWRFVVCDDVAYRATLVTDDAMRRALDMEAYAFARLDRVLAGAAADRAAGED
jgi:hypothetical protein